MPVVKQLSTGQSWLPDWMREVSAKVNFYQSRQNLGKRPAGAGLFISFGDGREASPDSSYCLVCPAGKGRGWMGLTSRTTISAHEAFSDKEGDGRSWGINNTSNLSGVE